MAAGLGFKTFNTGDVLSAADVNGYLMQGILVFASAAARDAAITSPEEGQFAFLKDTNVTTYYTGSAWANVDTTGMTNPMTTTGDVIYSSSGSTPARLGIGTAGQVLKVNSGATAPEWGAASVSLTSQSANLGADVTMTSANTYYDGATITLAAGTWFIVANIFLHDAASTLPGAMGAKLWDGSTVSSSLEFRGGAALGVTGTLSAIVSPASSTTYKISGVSSGANAVIKAAQISNGSGNNAGHISAVKIA
jgi:hypothetical protein